jgi:PAS domain-containing protein
MFLFPFQVFGYDITPGALTTMVVAILLASGALVKAISDINTLGWQPFKEKWLRPRKARRQRQEALLNKVEQMGEQVAEVLKEVKPNGGSSLRDAVTGIDNKVESINARVHHQDETSPIAIFRLDEHGMLVFANCAFRSLVNAEENELVFNKYLALIESTDRARMIAEIRDAVNLKIPLDTTVRFRISAHDSVAVRLRATPDVRSGGSLKGFFGTAQLAE